MAENPYESPKRAAPLNSRHTVRFLLAFYTLAVIWGLRGIYFWKPSLLDLLVPIAQATCLGWAVVDAQLHGRPIPLTARWWFFLFALLVVPCYVIWSRGWRGMLWLGIHSLGWLAVSAIVMNFGGVMFFGAEWLKAAAM